MSSEKKRYLGKCVLKIDDKGRVVVPGFCRVNGDGPFYVTEGRKRCLVLYDPEGRDRLFDMLEELSPFDSRREDITRVLGAGSDMVLDGHCRISINRDLRDFASLKGEVVFTGLLDHVEIWNRELYEKEHAGNLDNLNRNMQEIAESRQEKR